MQDKAALPAGSAGSPGPPQPACQPTTGSTPPPPLAHPLPACRALIRATLHLVNREFSALADDFIELGLLPAGSNREEIVPALTGVFEEALKGGVSNVSFGELSGNLGGCWADWAYG